MSENVILIGMPGSGKSTVGVILAKQMARTFLDTDITIQTETGQTLQELVDALGYLELRRIEADVLQRLVCLRTIISTGGSAVYSPEAMAHLKTLGTIVYLEVEYKQLEQRVTNQNSRGLARPDGQNFRELYEERVPLYESYADITIECGDLTADQIASRIADSCG